MCRGCKIREAIIARTHQALDAAVAKLADAHEALMTATIEAAGPTLVRKTQTFSNSNRAAAGPVIGRHSGEATSAPPAVRAEKPAPPTLPKTPARRAAGAPSQLALAL